VLPLGCKREMALFLVDIAAFLSNLIFFPKNNIASYSHLTKLLATFILGCGQSISSDESESLADSMQ